MLTKNYLARYAKSFNWAGFFLPKKTYEKCSALYDFCREADNIADDTGKLEVSVRILGNELIGLKMVVDDFKMKWLVFGVITIVALGWAGSTFGPALFDMVGDNVK